MRVILRAAAALLLACAGIMPASAASAQAACTVSLGGGCGWYVYPADTWSQGYTTYVNDQNVGCDAATCNDTLTVTDPGDWSLDTAVNAPAGFCSQVRTYPDVQQLTTDTSGNGTPLADWKAIYSSFAITSPATGSYEAAYDIWLGPDWQEVMIWVDTQDHDHGEVASGAPTIFGQPFHVYTSGNKASPGEIVVKLDANELSGTVHVKATLAWLTRHGWLTPADQSVNQVNFGWEVCGTGGQPETFSVSQYTLTGVSN